MSTTLKEAIQRHKKLQNIPEWIDVSILESIVRKVLEEVRGKNGVDGLDGKDADEEKIVSTVMARIRIPKDGKNGKDSVMVGPQGPKGENGKDAEDADEEFIIKSVLRRIEIPTPKDGKDGSDGKDAKIDMKLLRKEIKSAVEDHLEKRRVHVEDITGLSRTLESLRSMRNLGGHGGTMSKITATSIGNGNYRLSKITNPAEIQVFVGGARLFEENGDFSYPAGAHISQITLAAQFDVQVQSGVLLNVRGK